MSSTEEGSTGKRQHSERWESTEAVKMMLKKNVPLFDSMIRQLDEYKELRSVIEKMLFQRRQISLSKMRR